jgi:hypothetical protein
LSEQLDISRGRLVRVAVVGDPVSAKVLRDALGRAGIPSMVKNVDALTAFSAGGVMSLEIYVLEADAQAAAEIVEAEPDI